MANKINLYWFKHKEGKGNFGDELNPYLISRLTGRKIKHIDINFISDYKRLIIKALASSLFRGKCSPVFFLKYLYYNFICTPEILVAIGSILEGSKSSKNKIWGAGFINENTDKVKGKFYAVRGMGSLKKLEDMKLSTSIPIGDPALLLPLIYTPAKKGLKKISIIPHFQHYKRLKEALPGDFEIINLTDDIEKIIDQIANSDLTLSTSLHGIIVSHAYGIPSVWVDFPELEIHRLHGGDFKFNDYFSSVGITPYVAKSIEQIRKISADELAETINKDNIQYLPNQQVIRDIQINLLEVAPFQIAPKFKQLLK